MEKIETLKCKTKDFFYRNKGKIKTCAKIGIGIIVVGTGAFLIIDNRKKENTIKCMEGMIIAQNKKIDEMQELFKRKNCVKNDFGSRLLRQGIPEGGRQMAARKQWLKENRKAV